MEDTEGRVTRGREISVCWDHRESVAESVETVELPEYHSTHTTLRSKPLTSQSASHPHVIHKPQRQRQGQPYTDPSVIVTFTARSESMFVRLGFVAVRTSVTPAGIGALVLVFLAAGAEPGAPSSSSV